MFFYLAVIVDATAAIRVARINRMSFANANKVTICALNEIWLDRVKETQCCTKPTLLIAVHSVHITKIGNRLANDVGGNRFVLDKSHRNVSFRKVMMMVAVTLKLLSSLLIECSIKVLSVRNIQQSTDCMLCAKWKMARIRYEICSLIIILYSVLAHSLTIGMPVFLIPCC